MSGISPVPRSAFGALILAAACWGGGTVISKRAVAEIPPLTLLAIQLAASVAVLGLLRAVDVGRRARGRARGRTDGPSEEPTVPPALARLGLLNPGLGYALSLLGLVHVSASLSVLLWAVEPLLIVLLAALFLRERIGRGVVTLSAIAVAGLTLATVEPRDGGSVGGVALTLAGVGCCAIYSVVARRHLQGAHGAPTLSVVAAQQLWALAPAAGVVVLLALAGTSPWPTATSSAGWASAIASGVLYYGVAYWLYLSALRHLPASSAAASFYLVPVFGLAGGALLLGERLEPTQWLGALLVLGSVVALVAGTAPGGARAATAREHRSTA